MKVGLAGLFAGMADDNGVYLPSPTIADIILDELPYSGLSVEFIAEIGCDIIHADLFLERFVFFKHSFCLFLLLAFHMDLDLLRSSFFGWESSLP